MYFFKSESVRNVSARGPINYRKSRESSRREALPPRHHFYRHLARNGETGSPGDGDDTRPDKDVYRHGRARRIHRPNEDGAHR